MGDVVRMIDSGQGKQTARFQWHEGEWRNGETEYWVSDQETGLTKIIGNGTSMFCDTDGEDCLIPGTRRFYDALNGYFENEQAEVAKTYFGIDLEEEVRQIV